MPRSNLVQSVFQHLQSANKEKTSTKKTRIKRKYGEILTENQVLKQLEDEGAKKLNKKRKKVTMISDEGDEEESEIEISPLNDQKSCFKCKTVFGKVKTIKTNGFLVRNVTIGLEGNGFQEALI